jgi:hypothetical protein
LINFQKAVDMDEHTPESWTISAAEQVAQWRPIETAPKDGYFLAFKPGTRHILATILDMEHPDCEFDGGVHEAWSHDYVDGVTHWMPLPSEPGSDETLTATSVEPAVMDEKGEREAFEKWAQTVHLRVDRWNVNPELYDDEDTISAWQGWQARAAIAKATGSEA